MIRSLSIAKLTPTKTIWKFTGERAPQDSYLVIVLARLLFGLHGPSSHTTFKNSWSTCLKSSTRLRTIGIIVLNGSSSKSPNRSCSFSSQQVPCSSTSSSQTSSSTWANSKRSTQKLKSRSCVSGRFSLRNISTWVLSSLLRALTVSASKPPY